MGTRNLIEVKIDGELKVAQYGQWGGHLTGQGSDIADRIGLIKSEEFKIALRNCSFMTGSEIDDWNNDESKTLDNHPWLERSAGAKVIDMIADNNGLKLVNSETFKDDSLFCEFYYLIDMDDETVSVNGSKKYAFNEWTRELMEKMESEDE